MQWKQLQSIALVSLIMLVLSACGAGSESADSSESNTVAPQRFAIPNVFGDAAGNELAAHAEREEFTARCMAELGFEYVPVPFDSGQSMIPPDSRELRDVQGFGIVLDAPSSGPAGGQRRSANQEHLESLDAPARNRWMAALDGPSDSPVQFLREAGCSGAAAARHFPSDAKIDQLNFLVDQLNDMIVSDSELRVLEAAYETCMAQLGYGNVTSDSLVVGFVAAVQPLWEARDDDALARLAVEERNAALADWDCTDHESKLDRTADIERAFFDDHYAEFLYIMEGRLQLPDS